jgi:hypothetical protein
MSTTGKRNIILVAIGAAIALILIYFALVDKMDKRYQWNTSFKASSEQPYGTKFIRELLETYRPGAKFTFNNKKPLHQLLDSVKKDHPTDYIFIGESLYMSEKDVDAMRNFISAGNNAFIASVDPPKGLTDWLYSVDECNAEFVYKTADTEFAVLNFFHDTLTTERGYLYRFREGDKDVPYSWTTLSPDIFCDSSTSVIPVGYITPNKVNFARIPYGSGNLYLHTTPIAFANYFVAKKDRMPYVTGVFSHLGGTDIIWDEYSKVPFRPQDKDLESPLHYILKQPTLKYAWWMMLASVILYIIFAARRTQRVIPVLEPKANTSLEFVKLISALHFRNENHLDIARKKMKYFLYFIRAKYGIHTQHAREAQIKKLAEKSKVNEQQVRSIFEQYDMIEKHAHYNTAQDRLVDLYYSIEYFYKHCK